MFMITIRDYIKVVQSLIVRPYKEDIVKGYLSNILLNLF